MLEERDLEGEWWVPGEGVDHRPGTLHYGVDAFWLRTRGSILAVVEPGEPIFNRAVSPVVWGTLDDTNEDITLYEVSGYRPWSSTGHHRWQVETALVGGHFHAEASFDLVALRTEHFDEWVDAVGVATETTIGGDGRVTAVKASAERAILDSGELPDVGTVEVECQPRGRSSEREFAVAVKAQFRLHPARPLVVDEVFSEAAVLRELVRLSVGTRCAIEELEARSARPGDDGRRVWATALRRTAALLVPRPKGVDGFDMLLRRTTLPGGFEASLVAWREVRDRYRRAWELLAAADDVRLHDPADEFVAFSRAIESLHATDFGHSVAARDERDERLERAVAALPEDLVDWARPLLEASTPPIARHRVMEVIAVLGDLGRWLAGGHPEDFAAWVVGTRNHLVHPTEKPGKRVLEDTEDIFWFSVSLHWLGIAYLLHRLGVPEAELDGRVRRNGRAMNAADRLERLLAGAG